MDPTAAAERDVVDVAVALVGRALSLVSSGCEGGSGRVLGGRLRALELIDRMVEGHVAVVVGEAARSGVFADDGHVSVRNWVMAETGVPATEAEHRARTAALVAAVPVAGELLRVGGVGVAPVREMARVRANRRIGERLDDVASELLGEALTEPVHGFVRTLRAWAALVDADGAHRDHEVAHERRRLSVQRLDEAGGELRGSFGAAQLAEIDEIVEAYARAEFDAEWAALVAVHGAAACPSMLWRTAGQRRADGLVQALRDAAGRAAPSQDAVPVVNVVVPVDVFAEQVAAMVAGRDPVFDTTSTRLRLCQTTGGVPLDPVDAVAAALVGWVRRVVVDGQGRVVDLGRRRRVFSGAGREAALVQAVLDATGGRCLWPGCGRHRDCQVDHVEEWQHHGSTDLANAAWLCARHNRFKSHGYTVWRDPAAVWHVVRPDGTELGAA